jgi:hypothetical protein
MAANFTRVATLEADRCGPVGRTPERLATFELGGQRTMQSLEQVVLEVAAELDVDHALLASGRRDSTLVHARLEIARRALTGGVASLAAVAARLGRSASTLSEQLNRRRT